MDYADAVATFYAPRGPAGGGGAAGEPVAMHAVWNRHTIDRLAGLGLDFLASYVGGRAASLGDPSPPVVAATFAWFEPGLIAGLFETARAAVPRDQLLAA